MPFETAPLDLPPMARLAIVAAFILLMPAVCRRLRLPAVVGYIVAGVIIGPHGIGVIPRHADIANFFAELGKLLLMFFVGLEIDLRQFKADSKKSLMFGLAT